MKGLRDCIRLREVLKGEARLVGYNLPLIFDGLKLRLRSELRTWSRSLGLLDMALPRNNFNR